MKKIYRRDQPKANSCGPRPKVRRARLDSLVLSLTQFVLPVKVPRQSRLTLGEETTRRSSIAQFIRSASKLNLSNDGKKISKNLSTPYFRTQSAKEPSVCRFTCEPEEAEITTPASSNPRMFSASQSGATLDGSSAHPSGDMSRVMSDDGAMQMFAIGENDFRVAMESLGTGSAADESAAADGGQRSDGLGAKKPSLKFSFST
ncbi:hypothetical protein OESDEN_05731 [Oesophagostomum dentatum]|uniref:Uncharacterized protein n=1 Tax=Oesophagostomum dentatum TaxID=61180 RepID=A0A0B1TEU5_OESDE|nr:hypothetical protein OESDEN_05731 [Oesophagostomum dentatum]